MILRPPLQTPNTRQGSHPAIQGQRFQADAGILFGDESVEKTCIFACFQRRRNRSPVQWRNHTAAQHIEQAGAGGTTVTSVLDRGNRLYTDEVVVRLFSVAEWLITNWWHIWYEIEDTGSWARTEPSLREDALATASECAQLPWLAAWFDGVLEALAVEAHGNDWADVRRALPPAPLRPEPWTRGYTLARTTRERVGANGGRFDFATRGSMAMPTSRRSRRQLAFTGWWPRKHPPASRCPEANPAHDS